MLITLLFSIMLGSSDPNFELINRTNNTFQTKVYVDGVLHEYVMKPDDKLMFSAKDNILIHSKRVSNNCDDYQAAKGYENREAKLINGWFVYSRESPPKGYLWSILQPFKICQA